MYKYRISLESQLTENDVLRIPDPVRHEIRTKARLGHRREQLAKDFQISIRTVYNILAERKPDHYQRFG